MKTFKIAVPNKGFLTGATTNVFRTIGYQRHTDPKDPTLVDPIHDAEFYYLCPRNVAVHVGEGHLDVRITGRGMLLDSGVHVMEVMPLDFDGSRFWFTAPVDRSNDIAALAGKRIAASYPGLLGRQLDEHGIEANLMKPNRAAESATRLGVADVVVDVVDTGTILQHTGFEIFDEPVCVSEAILIRRNEDTESKGLASLRTRFESALVAQNYLVTDYNVAEPDLEATMAPASGVNGSTVSRLTEPGWMAVRVLAPRRGAHPLMDRLLEAGTRGITLIELGAVRF